MSAETLATITKEKLKDKIETALQNEMGQTRTSVFEFMDAFASTIDQQPVTTQGLIQAWELNFMRHNARLASSINGSINDRFPAVVKAISSNPQFIETVLQEFAEKRTSFKS